METKGTENFQREELTPGMIDKSRKIRTKGYLIRFVMRRSIVHVTTMALLEG